MAASEPTPESYLRLVNQVPRLSREEERELVARWYSAGEEAARDELVRRHLRYVVALALKYRRYGVPLSELIGEGNLAVVHALGKFEPERGLRFVTYAAYWIRAFLLNTVIHSWSLVGGGSGVLRSRVFFRLRRERARIGNLVGDGAEAKALLSQTLGIPPEKLAPMLDRLDVRDLSLDAKGPGENAPSLLELLPGSDDPEENLGAEERRRLLVEVVGQAVEHLDQRERFIAERRLMADKEAELSLAEIGRSLGVSRERVRQLELRTKQKLKARMSAALGVDAFIAEPVPA